MDRYLVIGNPISHSLSPRIHTLFAQQTNQILTYNALCVEPKDFVKTLDNFFYSGGKGANITAPFKSMAFDYVNSRCSERAKQAKAVNTLYINATDNLVYGDNTDGIGLLRDFENHQWLLAKKNILILGAGGATRGILSALFSARPTSITLYNRTVATIDSLIQEFHTLGTLHPFDSQKKDVDIIINTIPSATIAEAEFWYWLPSIIGSHTRAYDLNYANSLFLEKMKSFGCQYTLNGLGMLIEQAAESFFIWRNVRPETKISL